MTRLTELAPRPLWTFFDQICAIPHPSKHEAALCDWIRHWAAERGLACRQDIV